MFKTIYIHHPGVADHHGAPSGSDILHLAAEPKTFNLGLRLSRLILENPGVDVIAVSDLTLRPLDSSTNMEVQDD